MKSDIHALGFFYTRILRLAHTQAPLWGVGMSKLSYILAGQMPTRRYPPRFRSVRLFKQTHAIRSRSTVTPILGWRAPNSSRSEISNETKFTFLFHQPPITQLTKPVNFDSANISNYETRMISETGKNFAKEATRGETKLAVVKFLINHPAEGDNL